MTRINCIPVRELTDKHLLAEYRELPRVFKLVRFHALAGRTPDDIKRPTEYCLGTGHVKFFFDKCDWLYLRQVQLIEEMRRRSFKPTFTEPEGLLDGIPLVWRNNWKPTRRAIAANRSRIAERLAGA